MKQIILVENMSCQKCVKHVREHFLTLELVKSVSSMFVNIF